MTEPRRFVDDHSRVNVEPAGGVKYINANYIDVSMVEQMRFIPLYFTIFLLSHSTKYMQWRATKRIVYSPIKQKKRDGWEMGEGTSREIDGKEETTDNPLLKKSAFPLAASVFRLASFGFSVNRSYDIMASSFSTVMKACSFENVLKLKPQQYSAYSTLKNHP